MCYAIFLPAGNYHVLFHEKDRRKKGINCRWKEQLFFYELVINHDWEQNLQLGELHVHRFLCWSVEKAISCRKNKSWMVITARYSVVEALHFHFETSQFGNVVTRSWSEWIPGRKTRFLHCQCRCMEISGIYSNLSSQLFCQIYYLCWCLEITHALQCARCVTQM